MQDYIEQLLARNTKPYTKIEALVSLQSLLQNRKQMQTTLTTLANHWNWQKQKTQRLLVELSAKQVIHYEPSAKGITLRLWQTTEAAPPKPQARSQPPTLTQAKADSPVGQITLAFQQLFLYNAKQLALPTRAIERANPEKWHTPINKLLTTDGYTIEQVRAVYRYLKTNEFWRKQIFDPFRLRHKFQTLLANANAEKKTPKQEQLSEDQLRALIKERYDYEL